MGDTISSLLTKCYLDQYEHIFFKEGYTNIEFLKCLSKSEFGQEMTELGLKKGEWRHMYRQLHQNQAEIALPQEEIAPPPYQPPPYQPPPYQPPPYGFLHEF